MLRDIVKIDEELCDGCGNCVPGCHEGALQIIDGKARLVSDLMCDGLGACIGHCPQDAITIEKREAEPYDEIKVMDLMVPKGANTVVAHMKHLKDHNETGFLKEAKNYLLSNDRQLDFSAAEVIKDVHEHGSGCNNNTVGGCPGSASRSFAQEDQAPVFSLAGKADSELTHWPVQMHLINPAASHYKNSDLLLAADCVAFSVPDFHSRYLRGKKLAIACPKLDSGKEIYTDKIRRLIDEAEVKSIHLIIMQVPCCGGLHQLVQLAMAQAQRNVPVKITVVDIRGKEITSL
ncbi:MAG: 4Fe-4S binding protein [Bacteroidales bacterium]|nr:4Fe-4S binding protein [Bacteroidales bacterium]